MFALLRKEQGGYSCIDVVQVYTVYIKSRVVYNIEYNVNVVCIKCIMVL